MPDETNTLPTDQPVPAPAEEIPAPSETQTPPPIEPAPVPALAASPVPEPPTTPQPLSSPQTPSTPYSPSEDRAAVRSSPSPAPSPVAQTPTPPSTNPASAAAPTFDQKFSVNLGKWKEHLALALAKRLERKQARLNKLLALAQTQGTITNKQVKKALRCTKLTAWRYLKILEKQGQLRRTGGHNTPTYELVK
ncbi:MAG: hypothetical protein Q8N81_02720 [bacterium]|nr:hypothetical protein [bacterium]